MTLESVKIVQININCSWGAFDLLKQRMLEADIGLALISETPRGLVNSNTCFLSAEGIAAVLWRPDGTGVVL